MKGDPEERAVALGEYVVATGDTVRGAARRFGVSKSTVHKDLTVRLKKRSRTLYESAARVLRTNKAERHLRGGEATRHQYHPAECKRARQSGPVFLSVALYRKVL